MRLIDADALIGTVKNGKYDCYEEWDAIDRTINLIKHAPTIDAVEVVRGEWKDRSDGGRILYPWTESHECSQCESWGSSAWNYCPYCGAKMREGTDDE